MFSLSTRAKEAIKLGPSIVIANGIALRMDWANPQWVGFAVVMISLPTAGRSLNKGALRMLGWGIAQDDDSTGYSVLPTISLTCQ